MRPAVTYTLAGCSLALAVSFLDVGRAAPRAHDAVPLAQSAPRGGQTLRRQPAAFVPNVGQWQHSALYVARFGSATVLLEGRGWWLTVAPGTQACVDPQALHTGPADTRPVRGAALRMTFDASREPTLVAEDRLPGVHNYFLGNDPAHWRTDVPRYAAVTYRGLYPGVDLRAYEKDAHFEYDLIVAPGADLLRVEVCVEGADALRVGADGALVIETAGGTVCQPRPLTHTLLADGTRVQVACEYELRGDDRFGFVAPTWGGTTELVLDPGLIYSSLLGGSGEDICSALSVDATGVTTMVGVTRSPDFPMTPGAWDSTFDYGFDVFVARLDLRLPGAQQLVYSTYLGGPDYEYGFGVSVDTSGVVTLVGETSSATFPTTPGAYGTTIGGRWEAFVARLDPRLSGAQQLVYSTLLGGSGADSAAAVSVDAAGVVTLAGLTSSTDFPTTPGAWDTTADARDAFVARLDPRLPGQQQLVYSTFLGGLRDDRALALVVSAVGVVTVAGTTYSDDFPTTPGAWDTTFGGAGNDVFVASLDPRLPGAQQLVYSTFLGGGTRDEVFALSVSTAGVMTVAGQTASPDFPTTAGAYDSTLNGGLDAFVTCLDPNLQGAQQLVYSTLLGGTGTDGIAAIVVDNAGVITVAGSTSSLDFPTTRGAYDATYSGNPDAFVARFDPGLPSTQQLVYSTLLGGSGVDNANALAVDAEGVATVAGTTSSAGFPTTPGAWDTTHNGGFDVFLARLELLPTGTRLLGASSSGCAGPLAIGVTSMPSVGNSAFTLTCNNAPRSANGVLLVGARSRASPLPVLGIDVWIDPSGAWFVSPPTLSNAAGGTHFGLPVPRGSLGLRVNAQFVWLGPTFPPNCPPMGLSSSNAIEITIQP